MERVSIFRLIYKKNRIEKAQRNKKLAGGAICTPLPHLVVNY